MNEVLVLSKKLDHRTPIEFLDRVGMVGPVALDPAANKRALVGAKNYIHAPRGWKKKPSLIAGGLAADWISIAGNGLVYVNPPYGRHVQVWANKMVQEAVAGAHILTLVAARTDTQWFQRMATAERRPLILFIRGRLTYIGQKDPAPFPNAVIYWPSSEAKERRFRREFHDAGLLTRII